MPRDRLGALQAQAYFDDNEDYQTGMDDEQMDGPMAAFLQEMEEMRNNTAQIEADIQKVKKAQNEILTTPSVDAKTKQELEDAMNNIKKRANVVRTKLKATEKQNEDDEAQGKHSAAEMRMRKTQQQTCSRKFIELMTDYNKIQNDYREASKQKIGRQMELAGQGVTDEELENMLEAGEGAQLMGHVKIEGNEEQLRQTINDIQNRHEMFLNLEKSITELHDMFIDIAQLIENQGEMVNRIDAHVESAVEYTTRATNDTKNPWSTNQKPDAKRS